MSQSDIDRLAKAMPLITDNGVNEALTLGMFWDGPQMTEQARDGYRAQVRAVLKEAWNVVEDSTGGGYGKDFGTIIDELLAD